MQQKHCKESYPKPLNGILSKSFGEVRAWDTANSA